ncbi:fungal specific transcription factor [Fusarium mexicanum]|uniref:Fungal specific transcription factor n=1 Tax=Fusarium mexicanum TaxID=751941 RepID=A0A8H5MJW4_9HYPO|nr:fungal specific transcription factor [Fusarium mexicanum]
MPGVSLDTENLSNIADRLEAEHQSLNPALDGPRDLEGLGDNLEALEIDDEACTMQPVGDTAAYFSGEFSYWNFSMRIKNLIESQIQEPESRPGANSHNDDSDGYPRAHHLRPGRSHLSEAISSFPPASISNFLVTVFFKFAESYLFFVEQSWVFEKLDLLYKSPQVLSQPGNEATVSILLTVLAIGTQYAHLEHTDGSDTTSTPGLLEEEIGAMFYQQAIRLLPEIIEISSLESVQACLLFGYYSVPIDASGLGFIYLNLATRLGMQNGMHRKCSNSAFNASVIETRNRVWWTIYVVERVSVQLMYFLEDMYHEINILRNCRKREIVTIVSRLVAKKDSLTTWWQSLPPDTIGANEQPTMTQSRSVMHLRLDYCLVRMFVGRPFLLKKDTKDSATSPSAPENSPGTNERTASKLGASREELISDCIKAATEALDICQQLRSSEMGLARASYPEYSACRASLLVLIAYSIRNLSDQFRKSLCDGLDMIREMSAIGESARSEVSLIESLERALARLHAGPRPNDVGSRNQAGSDSAYEAFRSWGATLAGKNGLEAATTAAPNASGDQAETDSTSGWPVDFQALSSMDFFSAYDPMADPLLQLPFFGTENLSPTDGWLTQSETEILGQFITGPHRGN